MGMLVYAESSLAWIRESPRWLDHAKREMRAIIEREPYFSRGAILGSIYDSIDDNIPVPTLWNYFLVSEDMDDDLVYDLTSTLYEHARTVESTTPQAFETSLNNVEHILVPLHPGAARYFREQGIEIPEPAQPD
jgi:TRAP transporter TAXI family solute receptor